MKGKKRKKPYVECPYCHAHLDPGEKCDCQKKEQKKSA